MGEELQNGQIVGPKLVALPWRDDKGQSLITGRGLYNVRVTGLKLCVAPLT